MSSLAADPYAMGALEKPPAKAGAAPARAETDALVTEAQSRAIAQAATRDGITKNAASKTEFGKLENKFDRLENKFDRLTDKVDKLADKVNTLDKRVDRIDTKITMLMWIIGIATIVVVVPVIGAAVKIILFS